MVLKTQLTPKFIAYLRVSTTRQGTSGLGLEAQREAVETYVRSVGGTLLDEIVEVESGKLKDRPGLAEALARCRSVGATLVIAKLDRLARNVAFVSSLMEARTDFVAVDAPYANRLMLHMLAAFAEHEREAIVARTKSALAAAKARGVKLGAHGAVLARERKAEAVAFADTLLHVVKPLVEAGHTLEFIAGRLNDLGERTREGALWSPTPVKRLLKRLDLLNRRVGPRAPGGLVSKFSLPTGLTLNGPIQGGTCSSRCLGEASPDLKDAATEELRRVAQRPTRDHRPSGQRASP